MTKHRFEQSVLEDERIAGARCTRCGQIALYENGKIPDDIQHQDCCREDVNQAAARVVKEATKGV